MRNKELIFVMLSIILIGIVSAQNVSYCCERLQDNGPWCQNAPAENCDLNYRSVPTSCESTSYCRLGVCINSIEGTCLPNTPERVCTDNGGIWDERNKADIPQCQLGCCLIGDQATFSTLTRCKSLSSSYGLEINYRTDIQNEIECVASARSGNKGACVFEAEFQRDCKITTRAECQDMNTEDSSTEFYEGFLCSAENLTTICGPRGGTTCVEGRDEVYFLDGCGNLANVYDYDRLNDPVYWERIIAPGCSVDEDGAENCGNCDYFTGTTGKVAERGENPSYGNNICKDLGCEYEGEEYEHGETWCANSDGVRDNSVGSRYARMLCYNNEVTIEPCADFRQEICIQSDVNGFSAAGCVVNKWQDCYAQNNRDDCENIDERDCQWISEDDEVDLDENEIGCVPAYTPGFNFWEGSDAKDICSLGSNICYVEYDQTVFDIINGKKGLAYDLKCMEDCRAEAPLDDPLHIVDNACRKKCKSSVCVNNDGTIKEEWKTKMMELCNSLGDCGIKQNYIGQDGYYNDVNDFITRSSEGEENE